ncbi:hypothetical protein JX265_002437 [Neoarthrinium moseri]|uniref:Rhodopsin domain-containing protein n=1 Tax=Neoarthrinium moseri TaxID=1658444 RepID=A0A9P9WUE5_9PEZI|nr:hypothetical protein JX265_002437 [Neoarthrinium moseri]
MSTAGQVNGALFPDQIDPERAVESRLLWMMSIYAVLHLLAIVFVALRVYTRLFKIREFGIDDAFMVCAGALGFGGGLVVLIVMGTRGGLGRHIDTLSQDEITIFFKMNFLQLVTSTLVGIACVKISIGVSLLRLIPIGWHPRVILVTIGFVVAYTIMALLSAFLYCTPLAGFWDRRIPSTCFDRNLWVFFAYFNSCSNVLTDFIFATLPISVISTLQLRRKLRYYLIYIMGLGYIAGCCGIAKAACQTIFRSNPDQTYVELNIGIIAGCAPTLGPLLRGRLGLSNRDNEENIYTQRSGVPRSTHGLPASKFGYVKAASLYEQHERDSGASHFSSQKGPCVASTSLPGHDS